MACSLAQRCRYQLVVWPLTAGRAQHVSYGGGDDHQQYQAHTGGGGSFRQALDPDLAQYFEEIAATLETLQDPEERALLAGNVLEEVAGKVGCLCLFGLHTISPRLCFFSLALPHCHARAVMLV